MHVTGDRVAEHGLSTRRLGRRGRGCARRGTSSRTACWWATSSTARWRAEFGLAAVQRLRVRRQRRAHRDPADAQRLAAAGRPTAPTSTASSAAWRTASTSSATSRGRSTCSGSTSSSPASGSTGSAAAASTVSSRTSPTRPPPRTSGARWRRSAARRRTCSAGRSTAARASPARSRRCRTAAPAAMFDRGQRPQQRAGGRAMSRARRTIVERALARRPRAAASCSRAARSVANLRWARSTLTTNGETRRRLGHRHRARRRRRRCRRRGRSPRARRPSTSLADAGARAPRRAALAGAARPRTPPTSLRGIARLRRLGRRAGGRDRGVVRRRRPGARRGLRRRRVPTASSTSATPSRPRVTTYLGTSTGTAAALHRHRGSPRAHRPRATSAPARRGPGGPVARCAGVDLARRSTPSCVRASAGRRARVDVARGTPPRAADAERGRRPDDRPLLVVGRPLTAHEGAASGARRAAARASGEPVADPRVHLLSDPSLRRAGGAAVRHRPSRPPPRGERLRQRPAAAGHVDWIDAGVLDQPHHHPAHRGRDRPRVPPGVGQPAARRRRRAAARSTTSSRAPTTGCW